MIFMKNSTTNLKNLNSELKYALSGFLIIMSLGIFTGLLYINHTTDMSVFGTLEQYTGSEVKEYDIPEKFPKEYESMLLISHQHIVSFAFISFVIGAIFNFNTIINQKLKKFLIIEPYISIFITFSSMWLMRYFNSNFVYLLIISSTLMYLCWYVMILVSLYDLNRK